MPRPKTKPELIHLSRENFQKLYDYVQFLSPEEREMDFPKGTMNRNIRDVLCHLHEWHNMMLKWYEVGMSNEKPAMPAEGFTWKTSSDLNHKIFEDYQSTSLKEAKTLLIQSHNQVYKLIQKHSDDELFTKQKYHWTGSTSLGAYLISSTSSHYDWALKLIKKAVKKRGFTKKK